MRLSWKGRRSARRLRKTRRVAKLQQSVRDRAAALEVSPEVLATRRDVEALVFKDRPESAVLRGWRRAVIGEQLLADRDILLSEGTFWISAPIGGNPECPLGACPSSAARRNSAYTLSTGWSALTTFSRPRDW